MKKGQCRWAHLLTIFLFNLEPPEGNKYLDKNSIPIRLPVFQINSVQQGMGKQSRLLTLASVHLFVSLRTFPACLVMGNVTKTGINE